MKLLLRIEREMKKAEDACTHWHVSWLVSLYMMQNSPYRSWSQYKITAPKCLFFLILQGELSCFFFTMAAIWTVAGMKTNNLFTRYQPFIFYLKSILDCIAHAMQRTWQIDVSFLCVCPLIDDKLCHNIVKMGLFPLFWEKLYCINPC